MAAISIDQAKCTACGACVKACPVRIFVKDGAGEKARVPNGDPVTCIKCGHCLAACPVGAVSCFGMKAVSLDPAALPSKESAATFLRTRRSVRRYDTAPLTQDEIKEIFALAAYAPTGKNSQTIKWAVVSDPVKLKELARHVIAWMKYLQDQGRPLAAQFRVADLIAEWEDRRDPILRSAPHLVMAYSHKDDMFGPGSAPIALEYFELAAHALGYGTCWAGYFNIAVKFWPALQESLGIPADHVMHGALMLGRSDETYAAVPPRNAANVIWM